MDGNEFRSIPQRLDYGKASPGTLKAVIGLEATRDAAVWSILCSAATARRPGRGRWARPGTRFSS